MNTVRTSTGGKSHKKVPNSLNIQKTKIMASGPITSWQTEGEKVETVTDFPFLGFILTEDRDCSPKTKRCLFLLKEGKL